MRLPFFKWQQETERSRDPVVVLLGDNEAGDAQLLHEAEWEVATWLAELGWPIGTEMCVQLAGQDSRSVREQILGEPPSSDLIGSFSQGSTL